MLKCLVIDDEPLARNGIADYVRDIDFLILAGTCETPLDAVSLMEKENIDLLFLDIQMPKINGLDFLKSLPDPPLVIITTAYPSFALEGFQLDVLDYLVKPITFQRLFKAANKAKVQFNLLQQAAPTATANPDAGQDYFFVKQENKFEKIRLEELFFVESMQNYIQLHTSRGKITTLLTLKNIHQELPSSNFMQVHKSYIVAIDKIDSVEGNQLVIGEHKIPISRSKREEVMEKIVNHKLLRK